MTCEHNQNFWQLASIQSASLGIPAMLFTGQLAIRYGAGTAILSICLGNLVLWVIGLAVIAMVTQERINAIENVKRYIGKWGSLIGALILMFAFLDWFVLQVGTTAVAIGKLNNLNAQTQKDVLIRIGVMLGLLTALIAAGGIRWIKWITTIALPLLFCFHLYGVIGFDTSVSLSGTWGISMFAVISYVSIVLPGYINLPTFFRHSKTKAHSFLALTVMTVVISFFHVSSLWMSNIYTFSSFALSSSYLLIFGYMILAYVCVNLVNIYLASAGVEAILHRYARPAEYVMIGLVGIAAYTVIQVAAPMQLLENLANSFIASMGVVLLIAFLVRVVVRHRPRPQEKVINGVVWLVGCVVAVILKVLEPDDQVACVLGGIIASALSFLLVIFVEEVYWSVRHLPQSKKS